MGTTITVTCDTCGKTGTAVYDPVKNRYPLQGWLYRAPYQYFCPECYAKMKGEET